MGVSVWILGLPMNSLSLSLSQNCVLRKWKKEKKIFSYLWQLIFNILNKLFASAMKKKNDEMPYHTARLTNKKAKQKLWVVGWKSKFFLKQKLYLRNRLKIWKVMAKIMKWMKYKNAKRRNRFNIYTRYLKKVKKIFGTPWLQILFHHSHSDDLFHFTCTSLVNHKQK